jgi:cell division protein FtsN
VASLRSPGSEHRGRRAQRGGFYLGAVVGLLLGLAVALAVALYVNKVPIPFVDKVPQRTAEQDAAEAEKNRNWDPNAPLYGKPAAKAASAAADPIGAFATSIGAAASSVPAARAAAAAAVREEAARALAKIDSPADKASSAKSEGGAFMYYIQVGAYARDEDAEQQRAKLGMSGLVGRVTEREQAGKLVYRVRVGPYDTRGEADGAKEQAIAAGFPEAALVRVQR